MAVRSKRLWGPLAALPAIFTTLYTCPAGETAIIKAVTLRNLDAAAQTGQFFVNANLGANIIESQLLAAGALAYLERWWVLHPGDTLRFAGTGLSTWPTTGHGAELAGVAS